MAPVPPVGKRRPRHVAISWAALRQASACQYLRNCATEIKAQGCVEDLVCGGTRVARLSSERNSKRAAKLKELLFVVPGREGHRSASSNHLSPCSKHHFDPRFKIRKPGSAPSSTHRRATRLPPLHSPDRAHGISWSRRGTNQARSHCPPSPQL